MEFRILGELQVEDGGRAVALGGARQRALLTNLLLHAGEVVSADRLIDDLYGAHPPVTAAKSLQAHISRLRKALGTEQRLRTRGGGYVLELSDGELDVERFSTLLEEGRKRLAAGNPEQAVATLKQALALWRGSPLADVAYAEFAQGEVVRLEELHLAALEELIDARIALGRHVGAVGELERLVATHPLRERPLASLMLALYRSGRQPEALDAYQAARTNLVEELGIEPTRSLRELHQAILRQDAALDLPVATEPAAEPSRSGFVGREAELAELVAGLEDAYEGHGRLFLIVGEPGIGKSRLADEVIAHARARGARILVGRCWEAGGAPAYWPWVQSLRAFVRGSDGAALRSQLGAGAADVAQIIPELRQHIPDLPEPVVVESEGARFRLFDATAEFLQRASESVPIVLVLDDLHAADVPSLLLLQFLARELASARMLLVCNFRNVDPIPGEPLTAMLAELVREPVTRTLSLRGLSQRDVERYVELAASEIASPELAAALHEETEGNPLFIGETVRLLASEGLRDESTGIKLAIPQSVRDVIARRLRRLSDECKRVLTLASVLGREFDLDVLAHVSGIPLESLLEVLDEASAARVASEIPATGGRLRFAHSLIRDTLYEALPVGRRIRLHQQVGGALEILYADDPEPHLAELAHHFLIAARAGSQDKAIEYARQAGDHAARLLAYEEASRFYGTALALVEDEVACCELLLALGDAEARAGDGEGARTTFARAADTAKSLGAADFLARAALGYGGRIVWSRPTDDRLVPLLEDALAALGDQDNPLRARVLARLAGGGLRGRAAPERREALAREAVETARRTGDQAALAYALDGLVACLLRPDKLDEHLAVATQLVEIADPIGERERSLQGRLYRFVALMSLGRIEAADAELAEVARLAEELRQPTQLWQVTANRALQALFSGRLEDAEMLIARALDFGRNAQTRDAELTSRVHTYMLRREQGRLGETEAILERSGHEYPDRPMFRCLLAQVYAELGKEQSARRLVRELAKDDFAAVPLDDEWLFCMSAVAESCALFGDTDSVAVLYPLLLPYAERNAASIPEGITGSVARYLGLLASVGENWDAAANHFEDALVMNTRMGAKPWLARTECDYARMLLARGAQGDSARAAELLEVALTSSRELGIRPLVDKASELLAELSA